MKFGNLQFGAMLVILLLGIGVLTYFYGTKLMSGEDYTDLNTEMASNLSQAASKESAVEMTQDSSMHETQQNQLMMNEQQTQEMPSQPSALLPTSDSADAWARANPHGEGSLELKNFLESGEHIGVDTQASTMRNANRQIRSEPANPQQVVSPWLNATIMPDTIRKPLEIGGDF